MALTVTAVEALKQHVLI